MKEKAFSVWAAEHKNKLSREIVKAFRSHLGMGHRHPAPADTTLSKDVKLSDLLKYLTRPKDSITLSSKNLILGYKFMFSMILHIYVLLYCSGLHTGRILLSKNDFQCLCIHDILFTVSYLLFSYTYYILLHRTIFRHI